MPYDSYHLTDITHDLRLYFSTASGILLTPKHVFFYNIGDSRSFMVRGEKNIAFSTVDHKPFNESEKSRIVAGGGRVQQGRVNGMLAVSRALGDFELKSNPKLGQKAQLVSAEADVECIQRAKDDSFIAICCDGIFDVQKNEELVEFVNDRLPTKYELTDLTEELIDFCCFRVQAFFAQKFILILLFRARKIICPQ